MGNLASKALWILFSDGGAKLFGFFTTIYLARVLGAEQYGLITLALSITGICIWFSDLGIQTLATRSIAAHKPENRNPARFFWLKITLSVVVLLISSGLIWFILSGEPVLRLLVLLFLFSMIPQSLQIAWYYTGVQNFKWITLANWFQGGTYLGGLLLLVSTDDLLLVPVVYSLSILIGAISMLLSYRGEPSLIERVDISEWQSDIQKSFFLGLGHFMAHSVILLPPIIIGYFFNELQVGYYGVAFKLILVIMLADKAFNTLLLPNLTTLWNDRPDDVEPQLGFVAKWMVFFGSMGTLGLYFSAGILIPLLFGDGYEGAILMLKILSFLLPVTFLNSVYTFGLISIDRDREFMKSTFFGGITALLLMVAAGFTLQINLIIAAVVLSELAITLSMFYRFKSYFNLSIRFYIASVTGILGVSLALGILIPGNQWIGLVAAWFVFPVLLWGAGLLRPAEYQWLIRRIKG